MQRDSHALDREVVSSLFVLKRNKAEVRIDRDEYRVLERLCKLDLAAAAVVLVVFLKSMELRLKGKRSYVFLRRDINFRTLRRGHDH